MTQLLITGVAEVDAALADAGDRGARKAGRKAVNAGGQVYVLEIRRAIGSSGRLTRSAARRLQRTVKKRYRKNRQADAMEMKIGPGVAKQVLTGVHPELIHLLVLGTEDRYTGARTWRNKGGKASRETGNPRRYRGRMLPMNVVPRGAAAANGPAVAAMRKKLAVEIEREARRK